MKWVSKVGILDFLRRPEIQQQRHEKHHWPWSRYWHTLVSTFIISLITPRAKREVAAMTMVLHDALSTYVPYNSWIDRYVPWVVTRIWTRDEIRARGFAQRIGLHPVGCRAIERHMQKYVPAMWFDHFTALVMLADIITSFIETAMIPFLLLSGSRKLRP